jgi:hypothetical protein
MAQLFHKTDGAKTPKMETAPRLQSVSRVAMSAIPFARTLYCATEALVTMANSLFEGLPETISRELSGLIDNIVAICFERNPTRFLKTHLVPVDGTEQSLVRLEFDTLAFGVAFDAEFRATLRTMGLEYPRRNDGSIHDARSSVEV